MVSALLIKQDSRITEHIMKALLARVESDNDIAEEEKGGDVSSYPLSKQ